MGSSSALFMKEPLIRLGRMNASHISRARAMISRPELPAYRSRYSSFGPPETLIVDHLSLVVYVHYIPSGHPNGIPSHAPYQQAGWPDHQETLYSLVCIRCSTHITSLRPCSESTSTYRRLRGRRTHGKKRCIMRENVLKKTLLAWFAYTRVQRNCTTQEAAPHHSNCGKNPRITTGLCSSPEHE